MEDGNDRFRIYMVDETAVPITNSTSMAVLDSLESSDKTLSDISCEIGIPTSTVFFSLKTLIKSGVITSYTDEFNKKKVLYSFDSAKLIEFKYPDPELDKLISITLEKAVSDIGYFYRGVLMYISINYLREGLDITPALNHAGKVLAMQMKDKIKADNMPDLFDQIFKFGEAAKMPKTSIYTYVPLTIKMETNPNVSEKFLDIYASCISFVTQILEDNLNIRYVLSSTEACDDGSHFILTPIEAESKPDTVHNEPTVCVESKKFMVLYSDDKIRAVENGNQIDIIEKLNKADMRSSEISNSTGIPIPTVSSNLNKLSDMRLIESYTDDRKIGPIYRLRARVMLCTKPATRIPHAALDEMVKQAADCPDLYFKNILICLVNLFDSLGIGWSDTLKNAGSKFAEGMIKRFEMISPTEFTKYLCHAEMPFGSRIAIASRFPLSVEVTCAFPRNSAISRGMADVYDGFFNTLFNRFSDVHCIAKRTDIDSDAEKFLYTAVYID